MQDYKNTIIKMLEHYSYKKSRITVFKEACEFNALTIACIFDPFKKDERNKRRQEILSEYTGQDKAVFENVCNKIIEMLSNMPNHFQDYLGEIFMDIQAGNKRNGQFFTPYSVANFMAKIQFVEKPTHDKVITISEPCCGSGVMMIAVADTLNEYNFNYAQYAVAVASDIDLACVHMAYLQIAFCGMPALVQHKDSLANKCWDTFVTPAFSLQFNKFQNALQNN